MADEADLSAIRAWVAQGGQFQTDKEGNVVVPDAALADATPEQPATPASPAPTTPATPAPQAPTATPKQPPAAPKKPAGKPSKTFVGRVSDGLASWAENIPTPGGNLALVLMLLFFAFAIIPVNAGKTRLQLIWLVLTGNADLPGAGQASGPTAAQQVGSAIGTGAAAVGSQLPTGIGTAIGVATGNPALGGALGGALSGGGPGGPNAAGYIPPQQHSGAGPLSGMLEPPRGW